MQPVRSRSLVVALVVGGTIGTSASLVASASASVIPVQIYDYQGLRVVLPGRIVETPMDATGYRLGIVVLLRGKQPKSRPTARLTITRMASGGEKAATLADKRVRKGEARFTVSKRIGVRYRLQAQIGKRRWTSRLRTVEPGTIPQPGFGPPHGPCKPGATLTADTTTVAVGGTLPFHLFNDGGATLFYGPGNGWMQLVNGVWTTVLSPGGFGQALPTRIDPGVMQTGNGAVWSTLTPGTYRMTLSGTCSTTDVRGVVTTRTLLLQTAPITVTAAAGR